MMEILPKNSAYVNFRSNAGDTALHSAAKNGKIIVYWKNFQKNFVLILPISSN